MHVSYGDLTLRGPGSTVLLRLSISSSLCTRSPPTRPWLAALHSLVVAVERDVSPGPGNPGSPGVGCHPTREPPPSISVCVSQRRRNDTLEWEPALRLC